MNKKVLKWETAKKWGWISNLIKFNEDKNIEKRIRFD